MGPGKQGPLHGTAAHKTAARCTALMLHFCHYRGSPDLPVKNHLLMIRPRWCADERYPPNQLLQPSRRFVLDQLVDAPHITLLCPLAVPQQPRAHPASGSAGSGHRLQNPRQQRASAANQETSLSAGIREVSQMAQPIGQRPSPSKKEQIKPTRNQNQSFTQLEIHLSVKHICSVPAS